MTIELTPKEVKLLKELLDLDLESIGFDDDDDVETFKGISDKLEKK